MAQDHASSGTRGAEIVQASGHERGSDARSLPHRQHRQRTEAVPPFDNRTEVYAREGKVTDHVPFGVRHNRVGQVPEGSQPVDDPCFAATTVWVSAKRGAHDFGDGRDVGRAFEAKRCAHGLLRFQCASNSSSACGALVGTPCWAWFLSFRP